MPRDDQAEAGSGGRGLEKSVTELSVELTMAWLKRVESTADGRDPAEVVQALDQFFQAIERHHRTEMEAKRDMERAGSR